MLFPIAFDIRCSFHCFSQKSQTSICNCLLDSSTYMSHLMPAGNSNSVYSKLNYFFLFQTCSSYCISYLLNGTIVHYPCSCPSIDLEVLFNSFISHIQSVTKYHSFSNSFSLSQTAPVLQLHCHWLCSGHISSLDCCNSLFNCSKRQHGIVRISWLRHGSKPCLCHILYESLDKII